MQALRTDLSGQTLNQTGRAAPRRLDTGSPCSAFEYQTLGIGSEFLQRSVHRLHETWRTAHIEVLGEIVDRVREKRLVDPAMRVTLRFCIGAGQDAALAEMVAQFLFADDIGRFFVGEDQGMTIDVTREDPLNGVIPAPPARNTPGPW